MGAIEAAISTSDVFGVVVSGAAGVGKSTIARAALSVAASQGCEVRWAVGTSSARSVPLGAFSAWAESGVTDSVQLLGGVIASLTTAAAGTTVVVGVDDVHLLDDLSIFVVQQIVHRGLAKLVLTVRDSEPAPPAVQEIWKGGRFDRLEVQPLSLEATTALLSATLAGAVDPDTAQRLWQLTLGNTLYLRNIVEQELADGRIARHLGLWRWTGDPIMPPGLVELIESRIGALPMPVGEVIDAVAVGEPIELAALQRITDPAAVEEADSRGLITVEPAVGGAQVRVAHPLYGEVRRRRAPATRLRRLRGLVAAELAASRDHDDMRVVVRRATLSLDSDLAPEPDLLVRAANGAVWLADLPLAARIAEAAIRAGAGLDSRFIRAHALSWVGRGEEAEAILAEIDTGQLTVDDRARLAFLRASNMLWALGDPSRAKAIIDDASPVTTARARSYVDAFLTVYWFAVDQPDLAMQASQGLALDELPEVVGAEMASALAVISGDAGRSTEALAIAEAGYTAATRSLDAPHMRFNIADAHVSALLLAGRIGEALKAAERTRQQAADLPGAAHLLGPAVAGRAALGAGDTETASVSLEQTALALSAAGYAIGWGFRYRVSSVTALAIRGSSAEAAAGLSVIDTVRRPFRSLDYERSLARAWVVACQGAVSEAIVVLLSAAERAAGKGRFAAEVMCLQTATQFGDRSCAPRLCELEAVVEGPRVGLAARFAVAMRDGDADQLVLVSEDYEAMGDLVAAVDAAAQAALVHRSKGRRGSALSCSARASAIAEDWAISTPAFRHAAEPLPLTDRELEVVNLIRHGLHNNEIAARLMLSPRTVESYVYRAMAKTGTRSREELAALLPRQSDR
ncbi:helix-turn-helix transcriptional regulator [Mycolicibacterium lacusdiani]|uniref:helix-turn-helix transcriptional regulator n=1 Tax=Mycolicibacterium lacusdiani TaxID=2895283 RepID=UPI001EFFC9AC|nr:helix-turn-helix transcriptional regulator [Mycolicibacterium lacusdiani]